MWFLNRFNTNQAVQAQRMARGWKILDLESRGIVQSISRKTKALISFAVTAKLTCVFFSHMQIFVGFLVMRLICVGFVNHYYSGKPIFCFSMVESTFIFTGIRNNFIFLPIFFHEIIIGN